MISFASLPKYILTNFSKKLLVLVYKSAYSPFWRVYAKNPRNRYLEFPPEKVSKSRCIRTTSGR
jgi:hypothetical protein